MPEMSVKEEWMELVDKYGHDVEEQIENGNLHEVKWAYSEFLAFGPLRNPTLTKSEECALEHIKETFDIDGLRRPIYGVGFVYGNVGFKVKIREDEELSDKQKEHVELLDVVFVVVVDSDNAQIDRVIQ